MKGVYAARMLLGQAISRRVSQLHDRPPGDASFQQLLDCIVDSIEWKANDLGTYLAGRGETEQFLDLPPARDPGRNDAGAGADQVPGRPGKRPRGNHDDEEHAVLSQASEGALVRVGRR